MWRKGRWFTKRGFSLTKVASMLDLKHCWFMKTPFSVQIQFLQSHLHLTLSSPRWSRVRENDSIEKHFGTWLKFLLPDQNPSAALPKPHYRCTSKLFNATCTKAVCPDGGSRNCTRTFWTVVDGKRGICRLGFSIGNQFEI